MLSAVTSVQLLQHHSSLFSLLLLEGFFSLVHGVHSCKKKKKKKSGEGINKNVLAVTRDLSAGNEGPGEEDKGGKMHAVV